jgi:hypothetical protein
MRTTYNRFSGLVTIPKNDHRFQQIRNRFEQIPHQRTWKGDSHILAFLWALGLGSGLGLGLGGKGGTYINHLLALPRYDSRFHSGRIPILEKER